MKKYLVTLALFTALAAFAAEKPWLTASMKNPKEFFANASDIVRKVYPDPQIEMTTALTLAPFGFPNFQGIGNENFALALFGNPDAPQAFLAVKAAKNSAAYKFVQQSHMRNLEKDGWIIVQTAGNPTADIAEYADGAIDAAKEKSGAEISLTISDTGFLNAQKLPQNMPENVQKTYKVVMESLSQIESINISLFYAPDSLKLKTTTVAKKGSDIEKLLAEIPLKKRVKEAAFVPQDATFTVISSFNGKAAAKYYDKFAGGLLSGIGFSQAAINACKEISEYTTTSATAIRFAENGMTETISIAQTPLSLEKIVKATTMATTEALKNAGGTNAPTFGAEKKIIDGIEVYETSAIDAGENGMEIQPMFMAKKNDYFVSAQTAESVKAVFEKIENPPADYPLKKYVSANADAVAVLNNSQLLKTIFAQFGVDYNGSVDSCDTFVYFEKGKVKSDTFIPVKVLRAYADIIRKISQIQAEAQKGEEDESQNSEEDEAQ